MDMVRLDMDKPNMDKLNMVRSDMDNLNMDKPDTAIKMITTMDKKTMVTKNNLMVDTRKRITNTNKIGMVTTILVKSTKGNPDMDNLNMDNPDMVKLDMDKLDMDNLNMDNLNTEKPNMEKRVMIKP